MASISINVNSLTAQRNLGQGASALAISQTTQFYGINLIDGSFGTQQFQMDANTNPLPQGVLALLRRSTVQA